MDDLDGLARELAPRSARLRAFLKVLERGGPRRGPGHPRELLPQLLLEVMETFGVDQDRVFKEGCPPGPLGPVATFEDAVRFMAGREYLSTFQWRSQRRAAERLGSWPPLRRFEDGFITRCAEIGVPTFVVGFVRSGFVQDGLFVRGLKSERAVDCPHVAGMALDLGHATLGPELPPLCWSALHGVGQEVASELRLDLVPPPVDRPWHWAIKDWPDLHAERMARRAAGNPFPGDEDPFSDGYPRNWSKSPRGEVDALLAHCGIRNEPWSGDPFGGSSGGPDGDPPEEE